MNCHVGWTCAFLRAAFSITWVESTKAGGYRAFCKKVALDRERAKIPATLARMSQEREVEKARREADRHKDEAIRDLEKAKRKHEDEITRIEKMILEVKRAHKEARKKARSSTAKAPTFVCKCPVDECEGLIESHLHKCMLCERRICRKCRALLPATVAKHECSANDLATMKLLRSDTKPCPSCATQIFKIAGCDQMWCTQCRVAFSWSTGKLDKGAIHNPHALRWNREHGEMKRDINDVPCGGLIDVHHLGLSPQLEDIIVPIHRAVGEIDQHLEQNISPDNLDPLRERRVLKTITEARWNQTIFTRMRASERKKANTDILVLFRTLAVERFRHLVAVLTHLDFEQARMTAVLRAEHVLDRPAANAGIAVGDFTREMEGVRAFVNQAFADELPLLGTKSPLHISEDWGWEKRKPHT